MITLHHLDNSRSHRILWMLEELGVPYTIKHYKRDPRTLYAPSELREIHPLGKSPVISDGDVTIAESGAILEYLAERFDRFKPSEPLARRRYMYWMHYAEGSLMPPLLVKLITSRIRRAPWLVRPVAKAIAGQIDASFVLPNLQRHFAFIEQALGEHAWFAGDELSAADMQMSYPLEMASVRAGANGPNLRAFLERIRSRPAYVRALEKGGRIG